MELLEKIKSLSPEKQQHIVRMVEAYLMPRLYEEKDSYTVEDIERILGHFPAEKEWTAEELDDERLFPPDLTIKIELVDYKIHLMPDPTTRHQEILGNVFACLHAFLRKDRLGKVYPAPFSLHIDEGHVRKPDIVVVLSSKVDKVKERGIYEAPDLVVEVISPANYPKLREAKKQAYAEFGVSEYWEIYPSREEIHVGALEKEENELDYRTFSVASPEGNTEVKSKLLKGFSLSLEEAFA